MELTDVTNLAIETIFWTFITLIIFDFVDGLFQLWHNQTLVPVRANANFKPVPLTKHDLIAITPQFEQLLDPWELEPEPQPQAIETQSVVLPFPTLRLLPPATEVQPKPPKTKTTKTKSTKTNKQAKQALTEPPRKSRNKAAA
ncbi:hypothetical protein I8752_30110 [Nostocaceae cyanobacterium CENA369]|uniref:Uncharacterized protein n=1 Tax=Dendronalium phyllosphericum CENA369 TaxID=1725256 RepID=A0A8J7IQ27_9NOST|nr:hypothetical protein [Dendronalium phyllosphericum]MBH8577157.1 hypothetical protein [Dendronalium phyllosphericum CENA369]